MRSAEKIASRTVLERALLRDRIIVIAGLGSVVLLCWTYMFFGAGMDMAAMSMPVADQMPMPSGWTPVYFILMVVMWWVMMAAMMLPSAAPMLLLFAALTRTKAQPDDPALRVMLFAMGYMVIWGGFALGATMLQWRLDSTALLNPMMASVSKPLGAVLFIGAGVYQLTPLKDACLRYCQSPAQFLSQYWRRGNVGAFMIGIRHGVFCLGCCWVLMGLLFYGGVMNLYWIAGLAVYVLIEKLAPPVRWVKWLTGAALIAWGLLILTGAIAGKTGLA